MVAVSRIWLQWFPTWLLSGMKSIEWCLHYTSVTWAYISPCMQDCVRVKRDWLGLVLLKLKFLIGFLQLLEFKYFNEFVCIIRVCFFQGNFVVKFCPNIAKGQSKFSVITKYLNKTRGETLTHEECTGLDFDYEKHLHSSSTGYNSELGFW